MKRKVAKVGLRLSPNEEAQLVREEQDRRRKLRLQQVREQERYIALQIRKEVQQRRDRELQKLAVELKEEWQRQKTDKLETLERLYQENLRTVGQGHKSAKENEQDLEAIALRAEASHERAEERHREALKELKSRRRKQEEDQTRHIQARKKAMLNEKERAARVASLPPPPPDPFEKIETTAASSVKMSDVDRFSVTHYHLPVTTVDCEIDREQPDARVAAEEEGRRLEELGNEEERERREQLEKAQLRGGHALRKEHLAQDRERFLQDLERMQQADLLRRRQEVSKMPAQIFQPLYKRQEMRDEWQRDLEFAFEDMYAGERRVKGDLVLRLVPEPLPALSSDSLGEDLDVTVESAVMPLTEENVEQSQPPSPLTQEQEDTMAPEEGAPRHVLKKLLGRIRTQRAQWTTRSQSETGTDGMTLETGSLASEERERPTTPRPLNPNSDPIQPVMGHETTEESIVAGTLLRPTEKAVEVCIAEAERRKRDEEGLEQQQQQQQQQQMKDQLELLQQLEEQRRGLELLLQQAQLKTQERPQAARLEGSGKRAQDMPVHDHQIPSASSQPLEVAQPHIIPVPGSSSAEDEHSKKIRQYQQRLLDQNRLHKQSVQEARRRLEEYQYLLKMRYPCAAQPQRPDTAGSCLALHQKPMEIQDTGLGSGPSPTGVPYTATVSPFPSLTGILREPARVFGPTKSVALPLDHLDREGNFVSSLTATSSTQSDAPPEMPAMRGQLLQNSDAPFQHLASSGEGLSGTDIRPLTEVSRVTESLQSSEKILSPSVPRDLTSGASVPLGLERTSLEPVVSVRSDMEVWQRQLREADLGLERRKGAFLRQQGEQEETVRRQETQLRERIRRQHEAMDAFLTDMQQSLSGQAGLRGSLAEQPSQVSSLKGSFQTPIQNTSLQPHSSFRDDQSQASSLNHQPVTGGSMSQEVLISTASQPRAPRPPLARLRLGLLEMIEQHELSAIQEVETPVNASLAAAVEESCSVTEEPRGSEDIWSTGRWRSSASYGSEGKHAGQGGVEAGCSRKLSWRERLQMEVGTFTEPDHSGPSVLSGIPLSSSNIGQNLVSFPSPAVPIMRPCGEQERSQQRSVRRDSLLSVQKHSGLECLSSTTISTGSFSTQDPDLSSAGIDVRRGDLSDFTSSGQGFSDMSGHMSLSSESILNYSSMQRIIDKYAKELNFSLLCAPGSSPDSASARDVFDLGRSCSHSSIPRLRNQENIAHGQSLLSETDSSVLNPDQGTQTQNNFQGLDVSDQMLQDASNPRSADGDTCRHVVDTVGDVSMSRFEEEQDCSRHFTPLEPRPDLTSSSSSSSSREQISRTKERDSSVSRVVGQFSDKSSSQCLMKGREATVSQLSFQQSDETSQWLVEDDSLNSELNEVAACPQNEISGGTTVQCLPWRDHGIPGQSLGHQSLCPSIIPPREDSREIPRAESTLVTQVSHSVHDNLTDCSPEQQDTESFQEISGKCSLGPLDDSVKDEMDPASDSFHPLLAEITANEVAERSVFHPPEEGLRQLRLPEHVGYSLSHPELPSAGGSHPGTNLSCVEGSPEQLRADAPDPWLVSHQPLQDSLCQLSVSQSVSPDSESEFPIAEDLHLPARRLASLSLCDVPEADLPPVVGSPQSGDHRALALEDLALEDPVTEKPASNEPSGSKFCLPPWERILETGSGSGILEEELTLVSLAETTLQEEGLTAMGGEENEGLEGGGDHKEHTGDRFPVATASENSKSARVVGDAGSSKDQSLSSHAVMLLEFQSSHGDLQEAFLQRRKDFILQSAKRMDKIKARRTRIRDSANVKCPASIAEVEHGTMQQKPLEDAVKLKRVGEVRVCTPEQKKMEEVDMYQRTVRLYNQLEEVRQRKEVRTRQESYAKNREKAKEFHKKTLQKLRAKPTLPKLT